MLGDQAGDARHVDFKAVADTGPAVALDICRDVTVEDNTIAQSAGASEPVVLSARAEQGKRDGEEQSDHPRRPLKGALARFIGRLGIKRILPVLAILYSHVYSQRVDMSWDEAGRVGTTDAAKLREHAEMRRFAKADSHLENRWSRKAPKGSNPFPSARNGHFPRATLGPRSRVDDSFDDNQRAATSTGLVKNADARGDVTSARPRVWLGVGAFGQDGRSTRPALAPRPLATVSARVARRSLEQWIEP
jgi:hypothetical protein